MSFASDCCSRIRLPGSGHQQIAWVLEWFLMGPSSCSRMRIWEAFEFGPQLSPCICFRESALRFSQIYRALPAGLTTSLSVLPVLYTTVRTYKDRPVPRGRWNPGGRRFEIFLYTLTSCGGVLFWREQRAISCNRLRH